MTGNDSLMNQALSEMLRGTPAARRRRALRRVSLDVAFTLVVAWLVMIMFGILYHDVTVSIQPAGYGSCFALTVVGHMIGSAVVWTVRFARRLR